MASKLLNLLAISTLAILACSYGPTPVNALSVDSIHLSRNTRDHHVLAKKKRGNKRCKPRPSGSKSAAPTPTPTGNVNAGNNSNGNQGGNSGSGGKKSTSSTAPKPTQPSQPTKGNGGGGGCGSGGNKVGLAWPNGDDPALANFKTPKVTCLYSWSPFLPGGASKLGIEAVPMLWGEKQIGDFQRLVHEGTARTVLGFNEPNQHGQADMNPQRGAQVWQQYIQPLKSKGYKLVTPATTSAPSGKTWMKDFFAACKGCTFDALALHWYDISAQAFIDYVTDFHNTFGLNIWVTEFACQNFNDANKQCSRDQTFQFLDTVTKWMDETPWVEVYFAFGAMHDMQGVNTANQLMASNGRPTDLGYMYINN